VTSTTRAVLAHASARFSPERDPSRIVRAAGRMTRRSWRGSHTAPVHAGRLSGGLGVRSIKRAFIVRVVGAAIGEMRAIERKNLERALAANKPAKCCT